MTPSVNVLMTHFLDALFTTCPCHPTMYDGDHAGRGLTAHFESAYRGVIGEVMALRALE